jgi:hypothetical protein
MYLNIAKPKDMTSLYNISCIPRLYDFGSVAICSYMLSYSTHLIDMLMKVMMINKTLQ